MNSICPIDFNILLNPIIPYELRALFFDIEDTKNREYLFIYYHSVYTNILCRSHSDIQ